MDLSRQTQMILGLDVGRAMTRASLMGVVEGKYHLLGQGMAHSTLGAGQNVGEGVAAAVRDLQMASHRKLLTAEGNWIQPVRANGSGFDLLALTTSAGPNLRTAIIGLSDGGSLRAARALIASLPLDLVGAYDLSDLRDEAAMVDRLVDLQPELLVLAGGETGGATEPVYRWLELVRLLTHLWPDEVKPRIVYTGNPALWEAVQRLLDPTAAVQIAPNIYPLAGSFDLVPAQALLNHFILHKWGETLPGLRELIHQAGEQVSIVPFGVQRMARFFSRPSSFEPDAASERGVVIVDLGAGRTGLTVGIGGKALAVLDDLGFARVEAGLPEASCFVRRWARQSVPLDNVQAYLLRRGLHPALLPTTSVELALEQAWDRCRIQQAVDNLPSLYPDSPYTPADGWQGHFEPIIASGMALSAAPEPGQAMLMVLDGLQPQGVTTIVMDRYHLLPLLGALAATYPLLPIQLMETDAFQSLGTVIAPVSSAPAGEKILTTRMIKEEGDRFEVEVHQGELRRVVLQPGEPAVLELQPEPDTDLGFGGAGVGGRLRLSGGVLGVVLDARGRPLALPDDEEERQALVERWHFTLGVTPVEGV